MMIRITTYCSTKLIEEMNIMLRPVKFIIFLHPLSVFSHYEKIFIKCKVLKEKDRIANKSCLSKKMSDVLTTIAKYCSMNRAIWIYENYIKLNCHVTIISYTKC